MDEATARAEQAILGLRLAEGIDRTGITDASLHDGLAWGLRAGLVVEREGRLTLSARGRLLSNEVFRRLLPEAGPPQPARARS